MASENIIANFNKIVFLNSSKYFIYVNRLEDALKESGYKIESSFQNLIYFEPSDMRFQDYDGIEHIIQASKNSEIFYFRFIHMNWTHDTNISREVFKDSFENKINIEDL